MLNELDPASRAWEDSLYSERAVGDAGPWIWWLPLAWRAVADPQGTHPLPQPPSVTAADRVAVQAAWWTPLLHLAFARMGWARPDLALASWERIGHPVEDPCLALIDRWWGRGLDDLLAWAAAENTLREFSDEVTHRTGSVAVDADLPDRWRDVRREERWQSVWRGGYDPLHLVSHTRIGLLELDEHRSNDTLVTVANDESPRATLALEAYAGWYARLADLGDSLPQRPDGRSWRVDVVVRPLGWLGTYRQSRVSKRWFAGRHRWHELGQV